MSVERQRGGGKINGEENLTAFRENKQSQRRGHRLGHGESLWSRQQGGRKTTTGGGKERERSLSGKKGKVNERRESNLLEVKKGKRSGGGEKRFKKESCAESCPFTQKRIGGPQQTRSGEGIISWH